MNQDYINGAQARSTNQPNDTNKTEAWQRGWSAMDTHINFMLNNAKQMLYGMKMLADRNPYAAAYA